MSSRRAGQQDEPIQIGREPEAGPQDLEADVRRAIAQLEARKAQRLAGAKRAPKTAAGKSETVGHTGKASPKKASAKPSGRGKAAVRDTAAPPTVHRPLTLLEVADPADLDALLADPRVAALVTARLDPCAALVEAGGEAKLTAALRRAGHIPRVLDDDPRGLDDVPAGGVPQ